MVAEGESSEAELFPRSLILKVIPVVLVAVVAYIAIFFFSDARATIHQLGRISARCLALSLNLAIGSFVLRAIRWQYYLRTVGLRVPVRDSTLIFSIGLVMSLTPGKVGEIVKSLLLKQSWQIPVARSAPILLAERITDLVAVLLLGGAGLLAVPQGHIAGAIAIAGGATLAILCNAKRLGLELIERATRLRWVQRRREKVLSAYSALTDILRIGPLAVALTLACLSWGMQSVCIWTIAAGFPEARVSFAGSLIASCGPILAGAIALIPGGLGATEASMAGLLVGVGGPAMTVGTAVTITLFFRLVTFWLAIAIGLSALVLWRLRSTQVVSPELR